MRKDLDYDSVMRTQNNKQKIVEAFRKENRLHTKEWRIRWHHFQQPPWKLEINRRTFSKFQGKFFFDQNLISNKTINQDLEQKEYIFRHARSQKTELLGTLSQEVTGGSVPRDRNIWDPGSERFIIEGEGKEALR